LDFVLVGEVGVVTVIVFVGGVFTGVDVDFVSGLQGFEDLLGLGQGGDLAGQLAEVLFV
jgi:hypothetical protein